MMLQQIKLKKLQEMTMKLAKLIIMLQNKLWKSIIRLIINSKKVVGILKRKEARQIII